MFRVGELEPIVFLRSSQDKPGGRGAGEASHVLSQPVLPSKQRQRGSHDK